MASSPDVLELRLKRYLHYGSEQPMYQAGDRFHKKCYTADSIPSLYKLMAEYEPEKLVDIIVKVKKENTSLWPDAITFALAACAAQPKVPLQTAAYKELRTVCKTAYDIILFVKFYKGLKKDKGGGGGNGFKRAVAQWYLVWMPFDLADIFLYQRSYHGWKHGDVLRIAHVKPISIEQQVLFTFELKGLEEVKKRFGDDPNEQVKELLEYISTVNNFKRLKDQEKAAKALAVELHNIERVPSVLLKDQLVWNELIPNMDVKTLLDNLQRVSILGFLKNNCVTVMKVVDVLNNVYKAEQFKGHPTRVFIELMTYEKAAKYCLDMATKLNHPMSKITPARKPPKINLLIKNALVTFFYSLFKFQKPTGVRYLVAVDVRPKMFQDRCHHCLHLSPSEAAQVISLSLIRTEAEGAVTVAAFVEAKGDLEELHFNKDSEIAQYETAFTVKAEKQGPASVASAIYWAEVNKKPIDVFIILSNYMVVTSGTKTAITQYRKNMNLPNSRVITWSLSGNIKTHKDVEGLGMLCVVGFDERLYRLIEAVAKGCI